MGRGRIKCVCNDGQIWFNQKWVKCEVCDGVGSYPPEYPDDDNKDNKEEKK